MVTIPFAYTIKDARLSKMGGSDLEHNKSVCQVSTIIRLLTSKDGDLLSYFDKINETEAGILDSSLKQALINNHDLDSNKGQIKGQLPLEYIFGFCRTIKKLKKHWDFTYHSTLQIYEILYTHKAMILR